MKHQVAVVGGGVVGAALALALHRAGIDTALIERGAAPKPYDASDYDLRVYALSPASTRFLNELGVWPRIAQQRASAYQGMRIWDERPGEALQFEASALGVAQLGHIVENSLLLDELWKALASVPTYTKVQITGLQLDDDAARLQLDDGREISASLVIAADGADSQLRDWAGIECVRWSYPQEAVVCHVETELPHRGVARQRFLPGGPLAFLPLTDGRSSIVWSAQDAEDLLELDEDEFRARLALALQNELGAITGCTRRVAFPLRLLHAQDYALPRFALAGDAAHVVHPLAGQGVNLGLADAVVMVRELSAAREAGRDLGSLRLLKRYERERKADNLDMLAVTDGLNRAFGLRTDSWDSLRNLGISAVNRMTPLKNLLMRRAVG
ncbi:UbiH/UbiF/VisC/COQ6 family ubiquinone biosynthesis hydroxylase [Stenotrophobium rhamnosiphilum]|uniref:2-octaprenyl-3-methyl-6-methoxy-1,4-benzoquinol hydroxylase n=1 Tax=Stenotrophobium rhamnosiphilum TaxID=2029166 RepID=A0A2T5MKX2_9GAMM|nr:UbiH/UbiF/VisC/COQ6 family ubiquinone biosynthesis hydroxylase [Stenotrophobium rhamnosiphilum]PTU33226.1 2-octaprenyl-3-methyl-6-methoxy-1,4-benzoquinol hydroxylase [Stenotrophobium rhamnosiphilum]